MARKQGGDAEVTVQVDRDSVAMGDDAVSHARVLSVPGSTTLGALLAEVGPGVSVAGEASWVVRAGGDTRRGDDWVGMCSKALGMRVLRGPERTLASMARNGTVSVFFDYWSIAPGELVLEAMLGGRLPDRDALQQEGRLRHWAAEENAARTLASTSSQRLLGAEVLEALAVLGVRVEVHAPAYARLVAADGQAHVVRTDQFWGRLSMVDHDGSQHQIATTRPAQPLLDAVLVTHLATTWREAQGLEPAEPPASTRDTRVEVARTAGIWRASWTERGELREARFWPDGSLAARYAAYLRLGVPEITLLLGPAAQR